MKIEKYKNDMGSYNYCFKDGDKILAIHYAGNLDLYFSIMDKEMIIGNKNKVIDFDITKEEYEIYSLFDNLYNEVVDARVFEESEFKHDFDYKRSASYGTLVDRDKTITWISDDGPKEAEDRVKIFKLNEDTYRLSFIRNDKPLDSGFKSNVSISVRFRNSGSTYSPFNVVFMRFYQRLQNIDPEYHQIHIEEFEYSKKLKH